MDKLNTKRLYAAIALLGGLSASAAQASDLVAKFVSYNNVLKSTNDAKDHSSKEKLTVQGCQATTISWGDLGGNTVLEVYGNHTFGLGLDVDNDLVPDYAMVTGIWDNIDADVTKFSFIPDGDIKTDIGGWHYLLDMIGGTACNSDVNNHLEDLRKGTLKIIKAEATANYVSGAGTVRLTVEAYGDTTTSKLNPSANAQKIKFDLQIKGSWISGSSTSVISGGITNSGTIGGDISNSGTINASVTGIAVAATSGISGSITNSGTIAP